MVSAPLPAGQPPNPASILAARSASRNEQAPPLPYSSRVVDTVIDAACGASTLPIPGEREGVCAGRGGDGVGATARGAPPKPCVHSRRPQRLAQQTGTAAAVFVEGGRHSDRRRLRRQRHAEQCDN